MKLKEVSGSSCDPSGVPEFQKTVHLTLGGENNFTLKPYSCTGKFRANGPEGLPHILGPCLCLSQSRFNLNSFYRFEWSVSKLNLPCLGVERGENENNSLSGTA